MAETVINCARAEDAEVVILAAPYDRIVLEAVQGPLRDRTVIGTGIPKLDLDGWLAAWERAGLDEAVAVNLREANATRLLGL